MMKPLLLSRASSGHFTSDDIEPEILELVTQHNQGYNLSLFHNTNTSYKCNHCNSICRDAVELDCDHDVEPFTLLYCTQCLKILIKQNHGKCPINNQHSPKTTIGNSIRRQINYSKVICPFSTMYRERIKQSQKQNRQSNGNRKNITQNEQHDDMKYNNGNYKCKWKGTLKDLLTIHLEKCVKKHDPTILLNIKIRQLSEENEHLKKVWNQNNVKHKRQISKMEYKFRDNDEIIHDQNEKIKNLKKENKKLNQQLSKLSQTKSTKMTVSTVKNSSTQIKHKSVMTTMTYSISLFFRSWFIFIRSIFIHCVIWTNR